MLMKKIIFAVLLSVFAACVIDAQDMSSLKDRKSMNKYARKELEQRATKEARKAAKAYLKEGWHVSPGQLPLEKQLDRAYLMQYEFDAYGYPAYLMSEAMSVGESYDAAKFQATELAKMNLAGQISSEIVGLVENTVANEQLSPEQSASVSSTVAASKNIISQRIGRVISVVECYRVLPNKNKEVRVQIAYNSSMAMESAKQVVREELEKKGEELHEKLDDILNLNNVGK